MTIVLRIPGLDFVYLAIGVGCTEDLSNREGHTDSTPVPETFKSIPVNSDFRLTSTVKLTKLFPVSSPVE